MTTSTMMTVWRVEHRCGDPEDPQGPYGSRIEVQGTSRSLSNPLASVLQTDHGFSDKHPGPRTDGLAPFSIGPGVYFGCRSSAHLALWFKGYGYRLSEHGFVVRVYEVERSKVAIGVSGAQVTFPCAAARVVAEFECSTSFE